MKKLISAVYILISATMMNAVPLCAQEKLSNYNTSWSAVIPGTPLCEPAVTSYGFCIATDARNIMGFSSSGKLLWEKNIGHIRNLSITTLPCDFVLFYDKSNNILKLFNPSGGEIWSKALDFTLISKPLSGRDGRFFVYGQTTVSCYGINGTRRWTLETTPQKEVPAQELPDGSIIIFLADENGCTKGLRISPFGEQLENITFAGNINNTWTCKEGVLLSFTDGSAGLFSIENGLSVNRWVAQAKGETSVFSVKADGSDFRLITLSNEAITVYKINAADGSVISSKKFTELNGRQLERIDYSDSGLFICDQKTAILIDEDYNEMWSAQMPDAMMNKNVSFTGYLQNDYLLFCNRNWSINAYHTAQTPSKTKETVLKNIQADYSSFVSAEGIELNYAAEGSFFNSVKDPSISEKIKNGDFGSDEKKWLSQALSIARLYSLDNTSSDFGIRVENSVFKTDSAGFEAVLLQLSFLGTAQTQNAAADIISKSLNKSYCRVLMSNMCGYDPDAKLLDALERNAELAGNKDVSYLNSICDAVYSVCLFMGRPAYNRKGREIIKKFMGLGYPSGARTYARDTLKKIISLEL
ncbi:MAG: hypothetical protein K6A15_02340 [Treponema sp.]|nr:hypothetical protein [Treponema sp.]